MLAILLDISGSMAAPMEANDGLVRSRLDVAIESVRSVIASLEPSTEVALITFAHDAAVIFSGRAEDFQQIATRLQRLNAGGGTQASEGIRLVWTFFKQPPSTLVLITDGAIDWPAAAPMLDALAEAGTKIEILRLSSPDEPPARPTSQEAVAFSAPAVREALNAMTHPAAAPPPCDARDVCFTASYPGSARKAEWHPQSVAPPTDEHRPAPSPHPATGAPR